MTDLAIQFALSMTLNMIAVLIGLCVFVEMLAVWARPFLPNAPETSVVRLSWLRLGGFLTALCAIASRIAMEAPRVHALSQAGTDPASAPTNYTQALVATGLMVAAMTTVYGVIMRRGINVPMSPLSGRKAVYAAAIGGAVLMVFSVYTVGLQQWTSSSMAGTRIQGLMTAGVLDNQARAIARRIEAGCYADHVGPVEAIEAIPFDARKADTLTASVEDWQKSQRIRRRIAEAPCTREVRVFEGEDALFAESRTSGTTDSES